VTRSGPLAGRSPLRVILDRADRHRTPIHVSCAPSSDHNSMRWCLTRRAKKRREQGQRNCRCARSRPCAKIIALRSSTGRVKLHWRLGLGADPGRKARIAEVPGQPRRARRRGLQSNRKRMSSTASAGLPKRRAVGTHPCDALWLGWSLPCMSLNRSTHFERGPPCQKKRSRERNRKPN
jgi:hypothetical protein